MPREKSQLLLAGENKHPIGIFTQKKKAWDFLLDHSGAKKDAEFSRHYTLYLRGEEFSCTYARVCKALRDADRGEKLVIYGEKGISVYRIWNLPVNLAFVKKKKKLAKGKDAPAVTKIVLG